MTIFLIFFTTQFIFFITNGISLQYTCIFCPYTLSYNQSYKAKNCKNNYNNEVKMKRKATPIQELNLDTILFHQEFENNYRIKYQLNKSHGRKQIHTHNFYEILFCMTDNIYFLINDKVYPLIGNDLIFLNSTDVHGFIFDHDTLLERYIIEFNPDYINNVCEDFDLLQDFRSDDRIPIVHLNFEQTQTFLSLFNKLKSLETVEEEPTLPLYKKIRFTELLLQAHRYSKTAENTFSPSSNPKVMRMQNILSYINNHLADDLSVTNIAENFYISPSHLSSVFKQFTGLTINQYIINQRILLASSLLKENHSVQAVAEQSGFNNYAHFIRTFKKHVGISPKQYAKNFSD